MRRWREVDRVVLAGRAGGALMIIGTLRRDQAMLAAAEVRDPLTRLGNRRLLDERLSYELLRHRRAGRPFALMLMDLDRFKAVNEAFGHQAGDFLLTQVGEVLRVAVREQDTVVRLGGDEFVILTPETTADEAAPPARRLEDALLRLSAVGEPLRTSVGVATFPADGATAEELLAAADRGQRQTKARHREAARALDESRP